MNNEFLTALCEQKQREIFARIILLTWDEKPLEQIEGSITQGSINIDGRSAVRRTCSLTMLPWKKEVRTYLWTLNSKFQLEIGLKNNIDPNYPAIVWFKQGMFVLTSFNSSQTTNNFTISLQGKDKMCLLNGEVGGTLESSVDFGQIEEETQDGKWTIRKLPIVEIIRNAVHTYGGEPFHNIIINDLDTYGVELLEYRHDIPLYLYRPEGQDMYSNALLENDAQIYNNNTTSLKGLQDKQLEQLVTGMAGSASPEPVTYGDKSYIFTKIQYGDTAGYRTTDLVYAGDLVANISDNLVSILDKIKNMLVEFEYFYDIDGRFVFQKKQSFLETMWSPLSNSDTQPSGLAAFPTSIYSFKGLSQVTAFNNTPNINNVKNDYSVWGVRKGISGAEISVHMRYAIDTKPTQYTSVNVTEDEVKEYNLKYNTKLTGQSSKPYSTIGESAVDWREIIYQMALDHFKYGHLDDFELKLQKANPNEYPTGLTGYEQYYTDLLGFWRQLYISEEEFNTFQNKINELEQEKNIWEKALGDSYDSLSAYNYTLNISTNLEERADAQAKIDNINQQIEEQEKQLNICIQLIEEQENNKAQYYDNKSPYYLWNKNVIEHPETLNFWFDFLDTTGELEQFNTKAIGARPKVVNDNNVKSIYYRDIPNVIFTDNLGEEDKISGFKYIQVPGIDYMFSISAQGKSTKDRIDELLYEHGYCSESVSITSVPLYFLQPNTRISVQDNENDINGDYIISQMTIPLTYNGTMSITATKAVENIL